jgi:ferredoxin
VPVTAVRMTDAALADGVVAAPDVRSTGSPGKGKVLRVDPILCAGHGVCAELLPEWIRLDDWGYPVVRSEQVPKHLLARARWALANCPALALNFRQPTPTGRPERS